MKAQDKEAYEQFFKHMHRFLIGLPDSKVLLPLLARRISPEEADFLKEIPFLPHSIEEPVQKLEIAAAQLGAKLDPPQGEGRCIGCGVCVHKCPSRSLFLIHRQEEMDYPENLRELADRMISERGKDPLKVFYKLWKKDIDLFIIKSLS